MKGINCLFGMESLIVHNGIDGIAAAIVSIADGFDGDIYAVSAGCINKRMMIEPYDKVTLIDISIPREELNEQVRQRYIRVIDHHGRNGFICKYPGCIFDSRHCAAQTYYDMIVSRKSEHYRAADDFIHMVDMIDRWQVDDDSFERSIQLLHLFNGMMRPNRTAYGLIYHCGDVISSRYDEFINRIAFKLKFCHDQDLFFSIDERATIDAEQRILMKAYRDTIQTIDIRVDEADRIHAFCLVTGNISLVLARILKQFVDLDYVIGYEFCNEEMVRLYARSRSLSIDMNGLEGLEGHPTAAGGMMKKSEFQSILNNKSITFKLVIVDKRLKKLRGATPSELRSRYISIK